MAENTLKTALELHQAGQLAEAEAGYRRILAGDPENADALHLLGVLRHQSGDSAAAIPLIREATHLAPKAAHVFGNLAEVCLAAGDHDQALAAAREAFRLAPQDVSARQRLVRALIRVGSARFAESAWDDAEALYREALAVEPSSAVALSNLGSIHQVRGEADRAIAHYRQALAADPGLAETWLNLARVQAQERAFAEAADALRRYVELKPEDVTARLLIGEALEETGALEAAIAWYGAAAESAEGGDKATAWFKLGRVYRETGRLERATEAYRHALAADPADHGAFVNLFSCLNWLCDWPARDRLLPEIPERVRRIAAGEAEIETLFPLAVELPYVGGDERTPTRSSRHREARRAAAIQGNQLRRRPWIAALPPVARNDAVSTTHRDLHREILETIGRRLQERATPRPLAPPQPEARLRIGYASPDFGDHPISQVCRRLFALHDRDRFEVFCYSLHDRDADGSALRNEIRNTADRFVDLSERDVAAAANRIRAHGIDVLVDLTGYLRRGRPELFAHRPGRVQCYWLGHAGGLCAPYIDYLIADATVVPPGEEDRFGERIVRLPDTYHIADRMEIDPAPLRRRDFGLPEEATVFCAFNNPLKIDETVFAAWMEILRAAEGSVLWLSHGLSGATTANLRRAAEDRGVDPERLVFARWAQDKKLHLARHRLADLFLDTFRFNASSTTLDALWAGLPVLTVRGGRFYGRISASMLTAVGLPDLICETRDAYVDKAIALAHDPAALAAIRGRLASNRLTEPLFDTERFVRHLERAYEGMCRQARAGGAPRSFDVEPLPHG